MKEEKNIFIIKLIKTKKRGIMKKLAIYSMFVLVATFSFSCTKKDDCRKKCKTCAYVTKTSR